MKIFVKEVNGKEVNDVKEVKIMFSTKRYTYVPILNHLGEELTEQYEETEKFNDMFHPPVKPKKFKFRPIPKIFCQSWHGLVS